MSPPAALEELKAADLLLHYDIRCVADPKRRNKLLDAKIVLTPSLGFSGEMKKANQRHAAINAQAAFALPAASS